MMRFAAQYTLTPWISVAHVTNMSTIGLSTTGVKAKVGSAGDAEQVHVVSPRL